MSASSGFTDEEIQQTVALVQIYEWSRRAAIAALSWAVYDYLITFSTEIRHVWLRPWGWSKLLFGWTRYFGMSIVIVWTTSNILTPSEVSPAISCIIYYYFAAWGGVLTQMTLSVIMILRLWGLYNGNNKLAVFWASLLTIHITALCIIFGLGTRLPHYEPPAPYFTLDRNVCFEPSAPPSFIGIWASRLALDTIFFGFVLWKAYEEYRQGWHSSIAEMLITDNVTAFALVCLIQVMNLVILFSKNPQGAQAGVGFALASDVIVGSRLLLHAKEVINNRREPYETELEFGPEDAGSHSATKTSGGRSFATAVRESYEASSSSSPSRAPRPFIDVEPINLTIIEEI
ncbi:hypothetical protein DACRYDRAFT_117100 [Dacryopinax primogenitus]|uniref:DUF6533 domain-containing protein n=1 Tax=Dacryopinax primogenitus (strain DJM 731) TaxID=1858805 RepID=M5G474_DACPD|nr:uncharacterized protein DACRYDRAFT_117100 [Dacryopinax primogenitus]EJU00632.1 hypothetical protein DACRYDRAFT_117100 [Dacryopinax primogenitus]